MFYSFISSCMHMAFETFLFYWYFYKHSTFDLYFVLFFTSLLGFYRIKEAKPKKIKMMRSFLGIRMQKKGDRGNTCNMRNNTDTRLPKLKRPKAVCLVGYLIYKQRNKSITRQNRFVDSRPVLSIKRT